MRGINKIISVIVIINLLSCAGLAQLQDKDKQLLESSRKAVVALQQCKETEDTLRKQLLAAQNSHTQQTKEQDSYIKSLEISYKRAQTETKEAKEWLELLRIQHIDYVNRAEKQLKSEKRKTKIAIIGGVVTVILTLILK